MTLFIDPQTRYMTAGELPFPRTGTGVVHAHDNTCGRIEEDHLGAILVRLPEGKLITVNSHQQDDWLAPEHRIELQPSNGCGYAGC